MTGEPVSFVQFQVTEDEVVARNLPRVQQFCKASNFTEKEAWYQWGCDKKYGDFVDGEDNWKKMFLDINFMNGMENFTEEETDCFVIDSGKKSAGTIPGLEKELGLPHIENPDIQAVCQLNFDRAGESLKVRLVYEAELFSSTEAKLVKSEGDFVDGTSAGDEDHKLYELMFTDLGSEKMPCQRLFNLKEEDHPKVCAWKKKMEAIVQEKEKN